MHSFLESLPKELQTELTSLLVNFQDGKERTGFLSVVEKIYNFAKDNSDDMNRKKPKIETKADNEAKTNIFTLNDVSAISPIRKKVDFSISYNANTKSPEIHLLKDNISQLCITNLMNNVTFATFLPVPEKSNLSYLLIQYQESINPSFSEPVLLSLNKDSIIRQLSGLKVVNTLPGNAHLQGNFQQCIDYIRKQAILTGFRIVDPFNHSTKAFTESSHAVQPFYINCHRTTKEGTLYFLADYIIFGFKKPILIFKTSDINSITYSSITRLTFSCTLIDSNGEKTEFSMIDQSDYNTIDNYVKSKEVINKSMTAELKAKPVGKPQANEGVQESALAAAEKQLAESGPSINDINMNLDEDDEEGDENFVGESDLSDGSGDSDDDSEHENPGSHSIDNEEEEEEQKESNKQFTHTKQNAQEEKMDHVEEPEELEDEEDQNPSRHEQDYGNEDMDEEEEEEEEEDEEEDEEDSGAEYA
ncbi:hypothetical protein ACO0RG_000974 [Hanseniaspora osmophila]